MAKTFIVNVEANTSDFKEKIAAAGEQLEGFSKSAASIADRVEKIGAGVAGAFSIATGAVGAFGDALGYSQEEIEAAQKKAMSFVAIMQGVKPLMEGVTAGFELFNKALKANPIGVVILAITALVAAVAYFVSSSNEAAEATQELNDELEREIELTEFLANQRKMVEDERLRIMQLSGATESELAKQRQINAEKDLEDKRKINQNLVEEYNNIVKLANAGNDLSEAQEKSMEELPKKIQASNDAFRQAQSNAIIATAEVARAIADEEEEITKKQQDEYEKRVDQARKYAQNRIAAERQINDLTIGLMQDETERAVAEITERYRRLIEDTNKSENLLQSEKTRIVTLAEQEREQSIAEIRGAAEQRRMDQAKAENDRLLAMYQQYGAFQRSLIMDETEAALAEEQAAYDARIVQLDEFLANNLISQEQYMSDYLALVNQNEANVKAIKDKAAEEDKKRAEEQLAIERMKEQAKVDLAEQGLAAIAANLEEGSKAAKAVAAAQVLFDTYRGIQAAFANAKLNPATIPFPAYPYIQAAAAAAFGFANLRKILSAPTATAGGASPSVGSASAPATPSAPVTPSFNLFGNSRDLNDLGPSGSRVSNQPTTIRAVVVESDITSTQDRLNSIRENSEL